MYKKILTISLLTIILISIFAVNCYASSEFEFTFQDKEIPYVSSFVDIEPTILPFDNPKYFTLMNLGSKAWFWVSDTMPYLAFYSDDSSMKFHIDGNYTLFVYYWASDWQYDTWQVDRTGKDYGTWIPKSYLYYSNYDLKFEDLVIYEGQIPVPPDSPLVFSVKSINNMGSVMSETISILPITLTVVVGLVAIRKGISFINKNLRKA